MVIEKEQEMQERYHVQMSQEMIHHHHDHERYDHVQHDLEQKLGGNRAGARCVWHRKERATTITSQPMDGDVARIQMDFMFVGAKGTFVDEPRAKATVLMGFAKTMATCPRQKCVRRQKSTAWRWCFDS